MSNTAAATIAWLAVTAHLVIGFLAARSSQPLRLVGGLNLVMGLAVLVYWGVRWWGYLTRGVTWYASDQLLPLYALVVAVMGAMALAGRLAAMVPLWLVFGLDAIVVLVAALFLTFVRITRLI